MISGLCGPPTTDLVYFILADCKAGALNNLTSPRPHAAAKGASSKPQTTLLNSRQSCVLLVDLEAVIRRWWVVIKQVSGIRAGHYPRNPASECKTLLRSAGAVLALWFATMPMVASEIEPEYATAFTCSAGPVAAGPRHFRTILAGVPAMVRIPAHIEKPPIVLWHGFGSPASEAELMRALPLDNVPAMKIYLGLPLFGARTPPDDADSLQSRQAKDYGLLLFKPAVTGAADELPAVVRALQYHRCLRPGDKIGLFGFSASGAAVFYALAEHRVRVGAAVAVNAVVSLNEAIEALERATKRRYNWTPAARELAARSDAVGRARDIAAGDPPPALLLIQGKADTIVTTEGATSLTRALHPLYLRKRADERLKLLIEPRVEHDWSTAGSHEAIETLVSTWFDKYL